MAFREIFSRLRGHPVAQHLAQEVYGFYGSALRLIQGRNFQSAFFAIHLQHEPVALEAAEIWLQLRSDRVAEALAHELLHLRLPMLGFPLGELIEIPLHLDPYAREFISMSHWVLNFVQHELNYESFIALGFDRDRFLSRTGKPRRDRESADPERFIPEKWISPAGALSISGIGSRRVTAAMGIVRATPTMCLNGGRSITPSSGRGLTKSISGLTAGLSATPIGIQARSICCWS